MCSEWCKSVARQHLTPSLLYDNCACVRWYYLLPDVALDHLHAQIFFQSFDLVEELRTKRTLQDLDILTHLCFRDHSVAASVLVAPDGSTNANMATFAAFNGSHCKEAKKPLKPINGGGDVKKQPQKKERADLRRRQRRDRFTTNRPYLFGRVPATAAAGGACETCFAVVDEVRTPRVHSGSCVCHCVFRHLCIDSTVDMRSIIAVLWWRWLVGCDMRLSIREGTLLCFRGCLLLAVMMSTVGRVGWQVHTMLAHDVEGARQQVELGRRRDLSFDVAGTVEAVCSPRNDAFVGFSRDIQQFCRRALSGRVRKGSKVPQGTPHDVDILAVFAKHFSGTMPTAFNVFERKGKICGELHKECQTLEFQSPQAQVRPHGVEQLSGARGLTCVCMRVCMYVRGGHTLDATQ